MRIANRRLPCLYLQDEQAYLSKLTQILYAICLLEKRHDLPPQGFLLRFDDDGIHSITEQSSYNQKVCWLMSQAEEDQPYIFSTSDDAVAQLEVNAL